MNSLKFSESRDFVKDLIEENTNIGTCVIAQLYEDMNLCICKAYTGNILP